MRKSASEIIRNLETRIAKLEKSSHLIGMNDHFPHFEDEIDHEEQLKTNFMRSVNHYIFQMQAGFIKVKDPYGATFRVQDLSGGIGRGFITERMMDKGVKNLKVVKEFDVAKGVLNQNYEIMIELVSCRPGREGYDCVFNLELTQDGRSILDKATITTAKGRVGNQAKEIAEQFLTVIRS